MTVFTFLEDKTQEETTIEFTGEDPYLQYVCNCKTITLQTAFINFHIFTTEFSHKGEMCRTASL